MWIQTDSFTGSNAKVSLTTFLVKQEQIMTQGKMLNKGIWKREGSVNRRRVEKMEVREGETELAFVAYLASRVDVATGGVMLAG